MVRQYTNLIIDDIENGMLSREFVLNSLLAWLSEHEVAEFAKDNIYTDDTDEEQDEDEEEEEEDSYDVWVGGCVLNESISLERARDIKQSYILEGYNDVIIGKC